MNGEDYRRLRGKWNRRKEGREYRRRRKDKVTQIEEYLKEGRKKNIHKFIIQWMKEGK